MLRNWTAQNDHRTLTRDDTIIRDETTSGVDTGTLEAVARIVWALRTAYPTRPMVPTRYGVEVTVKPDTAREFAIDDDDLVGKSIMERDPRAFVGGSTETDTRQIVLNEKAFTTPGQGGIGMPVAERTQGWAYTLVHEYGHASDPVMGQPIEFILWAGTSKSLSQYGQTDPAEAYAEAFAEWILSKGHTTNVAARQYARMLGWTALPSLPVSAYLSGAQS